MHDTVINGLIDELSPVNSSHCEGIVIAFTIVDFAKRDRRALTSTASLSK